MPRGAKGYFLGEGHGQGGRPESVSPAGPVPHAAGHPLMVILASRSGYAKP